MLKLKLIFPMKIYQKKFCMKLQTNFKRVSNEIQKVLNDQKVGEIIREGFKIAIVGPTNVGKV